MTDATREKFLRFFPEEQALAIQSAADGHRNEPNSTNQGNDLFRWALLICLGYECMNRPTFRKEHGITISWALLRGWIIGYASLEDHMGDLDYVALLVGVYDPFIPCLWWVAGV